MTTETPGDEITTTDKPDGWRVYREKDGEPVSWVYIYHGFRAGQVSYRYNESTDKPYHLWFGDIKNACASLEEAQKIVEELAAEFYETELPWSWHTPNQGKDTELRRGNQVVGAVLFKASPFNVDEPYHIYFGNRFWGRSSGFDDAKEMLLHHAKGYFKGTPPNMGKWLPGALTADQVMSKARKYDEALRADDPRFSRDVVVLHEEGTTLFFRNAFIVRLAEWVLVFTEHHRYHVYSEDDLRGFWQYEPVEAEFLPGGE